MQTLNEIFSSFKLKKADILRLADEAKMVSIDYGKQGLTKELSKTTWNLFDDISDKVWYSTLPIQQKIYLGFQLFETFPSYYHFLTPFYHALRNKEIVQSNDKEIIWIHFLKYLASANYYSDPVSYVLWVDFLEDETTVSDTWQGLNKNNNDKAVLLRLLECAGPVPFELKEIQYNQLLNDKTSHELIFKSLLHSAFDYFGKIDKKKAVNILSKLKVNPKTENYNLLKAKLK